MASKTDEKDDVFTRLYGQVTCSAATRKRQQPSDKAKQHRAMRSTKSCPLLDTSVAAMTIATPCSQATLDGDPNDPHTLLRGVFQFYCRYGRTGAHGTSETTMDNANFAKFCRECPNLVGGQPHFSTVDIDLTFVKVKAKGERRISYPMFLEALGIIATKKYPDMALTSALPTLMDAHIATLGCLDSARSPGKTTWRRRASVTDESVAVTTPIEPSEGKALVSISEDMQQNEVETNQQVEAVTKIAPPPAPIATKHVAPAHTNNSSSSSQ